MNFVTTAITAVTITAASIAGCQPADKGPGIPIVENPVPMYNPFPRPTRQCVVTISEASLPGYVNARGCRVDVAMNDTITVPTPAERCASLGGRFAGEPRPVCGGVPL